MKPVTITHGTASPTGYAVRLVTGRGDVLKVFRSEPEARAWVAAQPGLRLVAETKG